MINITLVLIIKEMKFWTKSDLSEFSLNLDNESQKLEAEKRCGSHLR